MSNKIKVLEIAKKNNGVLFTNQVTESGIHRGILTDLVNEGLLTKIQHGIYLTEDAYVDDYFLLAKRFRKGIYSHETALFLLGFSDRTPQKFILTFEQGESTTRMKNENIHAVTVTKYFDIGIEQLQRSGGNIKVYNIERTLVDLMKPRYDVDYEQLMPALKRYASYNSKDVNKLFRYAKQFGVQQKMRNYMAVLL